MTEQEAVEVINNYKFDCTRPGTLRMIGALGIAVSCIEEIRQYRVIGTVEEYQEAREKQRAKKPVTYGDTRQGLDNNVNSISWQEDCYECPTCESFLGYVGDLKDENYQDNYCRCCGQAIDWSDIK